MTSSICEMTIDLSWELGKRLSSKAETCQLASSHDIASLLLSLQTAYDIIARGSGEPPTLLRVSEIRHPNMSIKLRGLRSNLVALKTWLVVNTALVCSLASLAETVIEKAGDDNSKTVIIVVNHGAAEAMKEVQQLVKDRGADTEVHGEVIDRVTRPVKVEEPPLSIRKVTIDEPSEIALESASPPPEGGAVKAPSRK
jgi:hypothetical protein